MSKTRRLQPVLRVGQRSGKEREFTLTRERHSADPVDLQDADSVYLTMEHNRFAYTAIESEECTITDTEYGTVRYEFSPEETSLHGRYRIQFEVEYDDGTTELYPADDTTWVLDVGRRIPEKQPLSISSLSAEEGTFDELQVDELFVTNATISEVIGDPDIDRLSLNSIDVGGYGEITRLDGPDLEITENNELAWVDPSEGGFTDGSDHQHSETGDGGDELYPRLLGSNPNPVETAFLDHIGGVTHYIGPNVPISEVNAKLEEIGEGETLFLRNGEYEVDATLEVPNNKRVTANRRQARLIVTDTEPLTAYTDVPSGQDACKAPVRNKSSVAENVQIENLYVKYDLPDMGDNTHTWAGVWLNNADHESHIQGCYAEDIMPDTDNSETRAYGILYTDCVGSTGYDLRGDNCGYEGIAVRGGNIGVTLERLRAFGNATHSMQASGSLGGTGDEGAQDRPQDITFRDIYCGGRVIMHGFPRDGEDHDGIHTDDANIVVENVKFEDPTQWSQTVRVYDECQGVIVRDAQSVTVGIEASYRSQNVLLENCGYDTDSWRAESDDGAPIAVVMRSANAELSGLTLRNCTVAAPRLLHIEDRNGSATIKDITLDNCYIEDPGMDDPTAMVVLEEVGTSVETLTFKNCWSKTDHLIRSVDECEVENIRIYESDLRELESVPFDGGTLSLSKASGNYGFRPAGEDDWREIARFVVNESGFEERVDTPDYVGQGEGAVRVIVRWESPNTPADIDIRVPSQAADDYYQLTMDDEGNTRRDTNQSEWKLVEGTDDGAYGGSAYAVVSCPRERPVCSRAGGSARLMRGDYMIKGAVNDVTNFTWIEVVSQQTFDEVEVIIEATPKTIA